MLRARTMLRMMLAQCRTEVQQLALIRSLCSLHSEACNALGASRCHSSKMAKWTVQLWMPIGWDTEVVQTHCSAEVVQFSCTHCDEDFARVERPAIAADFSRDFHCCTTFQDTSTSETQQTCCSSLGSPHSLVTCRVAHSLVLGDIISSIVLFWHGDDEDDNNEDNDNDNAGEPGELSQMDVQIPAGDAEEPELKQVFSCTWR